MRVIPVRGPIWISPSRRHIADREPEVRIERDDRTRELFDEIETIRALGSMPDGAVISGSLLMAAREEWRK